MMDLEMRDENGKWRKIGTVTEVGFPGPDPVPSKFVKRPVVRITPYVDNVREELSRLRKRHGIYLKNCGEDGRQWACDHQLRLSVLRRLARLERLADQAIGLPGQPDHVYYGCINRPTFHYSSTAIGRWVVYYHRQRERRNGQ